MNIGLFIGRALPKIGGSELVVDGLARAFVAQGHRTCVIAPRPKWWSFPDDSDKAYDVFRYPPHLSKTWGVDWYLRYLLRAHKKFSFDIIHCHELYPQAYLATRLKELLGTPVVFTSHGCDVFISHDRYRKAHVMEKVQYAASGVDAMIAVSGDTRRNYEALSERPAPVHEIPNGVDIPSLQTVCRRPKSLPEGIKERNFFLFLGRLTERKAADILILAYSKLDASTRLPLVIAGYGREEANLKRLAQKLRLQKEIFFVGAAFAEVKTYLLQQARCTIVPTRSWEACSLVTLESFAAGTPVIGTRVEGIEHLISEGKNGLLVDPEDPDALCRAMQVLGHSPGVSLRMGKKAKACVHSFALSRVCQEHLSLYSSLLGELPETSQREMVNN